MTKEIHIRCEQCKGEGSHKVEVPDSVRMFLHSSFCTSKELEVVFVRGTRGVSNEALADAGRSLAHWLHCYAPGNFVDALFNESTLLRGR